MCADGGWSADESQDPHHFFYPRTIITTSRRNRHSRVETRATCSWRGVMARNTCSVRVEMSWLKTHVRYAWRCHGSRHMLGAYEADLGRDRLEIQIRKLNNVSRYLIDHTVSQIQLKINDLSTVNTSGLVNTIRNRETCFEADFTVSDFSFRILSTRSLGYGESEIESDIWISNRSRP